MTQKLKANHNYYNFLQLCCAYMTSYYNEKACKYIIP